MMAEPGALKVCNERCGCVVPCPGGNACRCVTAETAAGEENHMWCPCGEHCGCNPCRCPMAVAGVGKDNCKCSENCRCETCAGWNRKPTSEKF